MSEKLFAFVVMSFDKALRPRYKRIQRAVKKAGMRAERVDDQSFYRQGIVDRIQHQIEEADFIIADMTAPPNSNVFYEVGYAHAKNKLCVFLTKDADTIPFDLRHLPHIVYSSPKKLTTKLLTALEVLKKQTDVSFDRNDPQCVEQVSVAVFTNTIVGQSQATSIRVRVRANKELEPTNVTAHITTIEKYTVDGKWQKIELPEYVQLTWAVTGIGKIAVDFADGIAKYVNVLHVDHNDNKIKRWQIPPSSPVEFFDFNQGTTYRLTVGVMARQIRIEIDWKGQWDTIQVRPAA